MRIEDLCVMLGWSTIINLTILLFWFSFFYLAHDIIFKIHNSCFKISIEKFNSYHYLSMGFFKIIIVVFNITPYLALRFTI